MRDDFFRTRMGQRFNESTMPKLVEQLERLNANIEALVIALQKLESRTGGLSRSASGVEPG